MTFALPPRAVVPPTERTPQSHPVLIPGFQLPRCSRVGRLLSLGAVLASLVMVVQGEEATSNIVDGVILPAGPAYTLGDLSSFSSLLVTNGGRQTNAGILLGNTATAHTNLAVVTGVGSSLYSTAALTVGQTGSFNKLLVLEGARGGSFSGTQLGVASNSCWNELVVSGAGSTLAVARGLSVGGAGQSNRVVVGAGGFLRSVAADIGARCSSSGNFVLVTGSGSVWSNGDLAIGFCSPGNSLVISNGGRVFASGQVWSSVQIPSSSGFNRVTVVGPDSLLQAAGSFNFAWGGVSNTFQLQDGARLEGRADSFGLSGRRSTARVSGPDTLWTNLTLTIGRGVLGAVGNGGSSNDVIFAEGARLVSGDVQIGQQDSSGANQVLLTGPGTDWTVTSNLQVGAWSDRNTFTVTDGATASAGLVLVGGTVTSGRTYGLGTGNQLRVEHGGRVTSRTGLLAGGLGRAGGQQVVMHDGAEISTAGSLWLGVDAGFNRLEITAGSRLATADSLVGLTLQASSNEVLVSGPGSSWTTRGLLLFASNAMGCQLVVSNGAALRTGSAIVGDRSWRGLCGLDEQNRILVTGAASRWENAGDLVVGGRSFTGTEVVVEEGASLSTQGRAIITRDPPPLACLLNPVLASSLNRIRVVGGTLAVTNAAGDAVLEPRSGTLTVSSGIVIADHLLLTNTHPSLGALELNGGLLRVHDAFFRQSGPVVVGDGTHQANLEIDIVNGIAPWLSTAGGLVVAPHAILSGGALVEGAVTNFGILRPSGAGMSGFTCLGPVFCQPGSAVELRIRSAQFGDGIPRGFDRIGLPPGSRLGGTLRVKLLDGFIPTPADDFPVLSLGADSGEFVNAPNGGRVRTEDGLGSFLVTYTGFSVRLSQFLSLDQDGDGIADDWAVAYFGHSPLTAGEKGADGDADGMSNGEEFRAGTDPMDATSVLRARIRWQGGRAEVEFPTVEGKSYRLLAAPDLANWVEVASPSLTYPGSGRCQWTDDGRDTSALPGGARFFGVVLGD